MTHRWREEALERIADRRGPCPPVWGNGVKVSIPGQIRAGSSRSQPTITRIPADGSRLGTADTRADGDPHAVIGGLGDLAARAECPCHKLSPWSSVGNFVQQCWPAPSRFHFACGSVPR